MKVLQIRNVQLGGVLSDLARDVRGIGQERAQKPEGPELDGEAETGMVSPPLGHELSVGVVQKEGPLQLCASRRSGESPRRLPAHRRDSTGMLGRRESSPTWARLWRPFSVDSSSRPGRHWRRASRRRPRSAFVAMRARRRAAADPGVRQRSRPRTDDVADHHHLDRAHHDDRDPGPEGTEPARLSEAEEQPGQRAGDAQPPPRGRPPPPDRQPGDGGEDHSAEGGARQAHRTFVGWRGRDGNQEDPYHRTDDPEDDHEDAHPPWAVLSHALLYGAA